MAMTEKEAREKWCPFARSMHINNEYTRAKSAAYNRLNSPSQFDKLSPESCRCIASDCMAWRWAVEYIEDLNEHGHFRGWKEEASTEKGYCGLAGKP